MTTIADIFDLLERVYQGDFDHLIVHENPGGSSARLERVSGALRYEFPALGILRQVS